MKKKIGILMIFIALLIVVSVCAIINLKDKNPEEIITSSNKEEWNSVETQPKEYVRMIKVNGKIYKDTQKLSEIKYRCGVMDGYITSSVESDQIPENDNESNFGEGFGYQTTGDENTIEVRIDNAFIVFEYSKEEQN